MEDGGWIRDERRDLAVALPTSTQLSMTMTTRIE